MKIKFLYSIACVLFTTAFFAQDYYNFPSTGQQKLLLNPSFCAGSEGFNVQTVGSYYKEKYANGTEFANYTGLSYGLKNWGFGLSNTYASYEANLAGLEDNYRSQGNQTSLSLAYKIKLGSRISVIPSLQAAFSTSRSSYDSYGDYSKTKLGDFSTGLLMDINKLLTVGAAFYDINQKGYFRQVYHVSLLLFRQKNFNFQPYALAKRIYSINYYEAGAYTSFKLFTLQTAYRTGIFSSGSIVAGLNVNIARVKFGYTFAHSVQDNSISNTMYHELFFAANLKNKNRQRSLMVDEKD